MKKHILVDVDSLKNPEYKVYRVVYGYDTYKDLKSFIDFFKSNNSIHYNRTVQFVDSDTGETMKGPKYDNTTQEPNERSIEYFLKEKDRIIIVF